MKATEKLRAQLAQIGATLDDTDYSLHCDAPSGYIWRATGEVGLTIHYATNSQSWLVKAIAMELPNLRMGLELATDEKKIEICWNNDCESWNAPEGSPERINFPA